MVYVCQCYLSCEEISLGFILFDICGSHISHRIKCGSRVQINSKQHRLELKNTLIHGICLSMISIQYPTCHCLFPKGDNLDSYSCVIYVAQECKSIPNSVRSKQFEWNSYIRHCPKHGLCVSVLCCIYCTPPKEFPAK